MNKAGRPSNEEREKKDPFATKEAMRRGRRRMRQTDIMINDAAPSDRRVLIEQFVLLWEQLRVAERHEHDLRKKGLK